MTNLSIKKKMHIAMTAVATVVDGMLMVAKVGLRLEMTLTISSTKSKTLTTTTTSRLLVDLRLMAEVDDYGKEEEDDEEVIK